MARLNELNLAQDQIPGGFDDLPEQMGAFADPPQPGAYRVRMPQPGPLAEGWDVIDTKRGQRIVAIHRDDNALLIVQSPGGTHNGEPLDTRISNAERQRGKDETKLASDMDYALIAMKYPGQKPQNNRQYAEAYQACAGKEFGIDWAFSWYCSDKKPIRVEDPVNGTVVMDGQDGRQEQKGCGNRYYQKDVQKIPSADGTTMEYPVRITCDCGAQLRAYGQIDRFRS